MRRDESMGAAADRHVPQSILVLVAAVSIAAAAAAARAETRVIAGSTGFKVSVETINEFDEPWAMTFLPDGRMLVTEKGGTLQLVSADGSTKTAVAGVPEVAYGGQGGLGDVIIHPDYGENGWLYLSFAEPGEDDTRGAAVIRARLGGSEGSPALTDSEPIWRQQPKVSGSGHYGHRLAFGPDKKLYITSGDRRKQKPAQDFDQSLGKVIRLNEDGSVPPDNPFQDRGDLARTFFSLGHRNSLGIAFDADGRLWTHEMGPRHGDELNLTVAGENYGWPEVSWGNHYSGLDIPDHNTRPEFDQPEAYWVPTIAPSGMIIYSGDLFDKWRGDALIGGLRSEALIRVELGPTTAVELERFDMGRRIREVEQGPDGAVWLLEDRRGARLLRLTPAD